MNKNQNTKEKICAFYTSDYHFEMISLPYISKKIDENSKIIILTENNLENTVYKLISNINLDENKKKKLLDLNWKDKDINNTKNINKEMNSFYETIVIIKGKEKYIKNTNKDLEKLLQKGSNIKIIDCYELEEISYKMDELISNYSKILSTKGEKNIY